MPIVVPVPSVLRAVGDPHDQEAHHHDEHEPQRREQGDPQCALLGRRDGGVLLLVLGDVGGPGAERRRPGSR